MAEREERKRNLLSEILREIASIGPLTFFIENNHFRINTEFEHADPPFSDNGSANAETFPYNETPKVTAALRGEKPYYANKTDKR